MDGIYGKRFVGARTPGWHHIGTVVPEYELDDFSVEKAIKRGGIDYRYAGAPIGFTDPDGNFITSAHKQVILREPQEGDNGRWVELGVVSDEYRFMQNMELAQGLDAISNRTGWKFETVGALGKGGTVFMTLKAEDREVAGDKYETYLIVSDGKATDRALSIAIAPVRVVCQNTLLASDSQAEVRIKIAHDVEVANNYDFWLNHIGDLHKAQTVMFESLDLMTRVKIDDETARGIFEVAFPLPSKNEKAKQHEIVEGMETLEEGAKTDILAKLAEGVKDHEYFTAYWQKRQDTAFELYERFNAGREQGAGRGKMRKLTLDTVKNTPYAALQAVTELADWTGTANDKRAAESAIFGASARIKRRAWDAAMNVAS